MSTSLARFVRSAIRERKRREADVSLEDLLEQYAVWLPEGGELNGGSPSSYLSYARSLDRGPFLDYQQAHPGETDYLIQIISALRAGNRKEVEAITERLDDFLTRLLKDAKDKPKASAYPEKGLSDWRSGWRKFTTFLLAEWDELRGESADTPTLAEAVDNFREWLIIDWGFGVASAATYRSRLLNIQKKLFDASGLGNAISIVQALALAEDEEAVSLAGDLVSIVEWEGFTGMKKTGWEKTVWQSSLSVIKKYQEFIQAIAEPYSFRASSRSKLKPLGLDAKESSKQAKVLEGKYLAVVQKFSREMLLNTFSSRLRTQYREGRLPIKEIVSLLPTAQGNNPMLGHYIDLWCERRLESMQVYTKDGVYPFSLVQELRLELGGGVFVKIKGVGERQLYTHTKEGALQPMEAKDISEVTLRNTPSPAGFIDEHADELRLLPLSADELAEQVEHLAGEDERQRSRFFLDLIHDLDFIADHIQLELMQASENVNSGK